MVSSSSESSALARLNSFEQALNREWDDICQSVERQGPYGAWIASKILRRLTVNAPVTLSFTILCLVVHVLTWGGNATSITRFLAVHDYWHGMSISQYTSFWTHTFVHSSYQHLRGNLTLLLLVGPSVEYHFHSRNVVWIMTIVSLVSALVHILIGKSNTHQLGASGIVFSFILLNSMVSAKQGEIPMAFLLTVIMYMGEEFWLFVWPTDNISHHAHLTGGLVGAVAGFYIHGTLQTNQPKPKSKRTAGISSLFTRGSKKKE